MILKVSLKVPWWINIYCRMVYIKVALGFNVDLAASSAFILRHIKHKIEPSE